MTTNQCQSKRNLMSKDLSRHHPLANFYYRMLLCTLCICTFVTFGTFVCVYLWKQCKRSDGMTTNQSQSNRRGESECERGWKGFEKATLQYSAWCWTRKRNKCIQTARSKLQAMEHTGGSIQGRGGRVEVNMGCHLGKWRLCCKTEYTVSLSF